MYCRFYVKLLVAIELLISCCSFLPLLSFKYHGKRNFEIHLSRRVEVTFPYPSGLLLTPNLPTSDKDSHPTNDIFCIVQHNVQSLRPHLKRVGVMEGALTESVCETLIADCEKYALDHGGWTSARHRDYPTTDLPLDVIFGKFSSIHGLVTGNILPEMASFFDISEDHLSVAELFIAKYEFKEGKQKKLDPHVDGTPYSFVVSLNDPLVEFTGGGTRFIESDTTYRPSKVGTAVLFSGKNMHEGVAVTSGIRYILTGFCYYRNPDKSHRTFLTNYLSEHDGSAAGGSSKTHNPQLDSTVEHKTIPRVALKLKRAESSGGVHTGDVLRGIRVFNNKMNETDSVGRFNASTTTRRLEDDTAGGTMVMFDGMSVSEVQQMVRYCGARMDSRNCTLLVDRDDGDEGQYEDDEENSAKGEQGVMDMGNTADEDSELLKGGSPIIEENSTELDEERRFVCKTVDAIVGNGDYWTLDSMLQIGMSQRGPGGWI